MVFEKIRDLVVEQLGIDADMVKPETNMMKDLEADSLDAVEIILGIEEEFGLDIPDEEAEKFETIQDLIDYVENHEDK